MKKLVNRSYQLSIETIDSNLKPKTMNASKGVEKTKNNDYSPDQVSAIVSGIYKIDGIDYLPKKTKSDLLISNHTTAAFYPLKLEDELFLSDVLRTENHERNHYWELINSNLQLLKSIITLNKGVRFDELLELGNQIQITDAEFAKTKIRQPQDEVHLRYGPNKDHPYGKTTLCRTTFPVRIGNRIVPFFFEKFLIAYSYYDGNQKRHSTVTPIHSHPYNFETAYFTNYGPKSYIVEQEFQLLKKDGTAFWDSDKIEILKKCPNQANSFKDLIVEPLRKSTIYAGSEPIVLPPFEIDRLLANENIIEFTDGYFRAHQVSVHDDPDIGGGTLYYTILNYFGPNNRVVLYADNGNNALWDSNLWI